jgi:hypothetical protein
LATNLSTFEGGCKEFADWMANTIKSRWIRNDNKTWIKAHHLQYCIYIYIYIYIFYLFYFILFYFTFLFFNYQGQQ